MTRAAALSLLLGFALGCGKYGAPVRAAQVEAAAEKPPAKLELPVPAPGAEPPPEAPAPPAEAPAPPPESSAEPEQEPPPEGTP